MGCDLCGYSGELFTAQIEGILMDVCGKCLRFGNLIEKKRDISIEKIIPKLKKETIFLLKEDYNIKIKKIREKLNLTQEDLAKKLNEKASLIHKLENKGIEPNENIIKKIENLFKIKLTEEYSEEKAKFDFKSDSLTIGDLLKLKKDKN